MKKTNQIAGQRGVVVVVALFMVALVAALSYLMISRIERDIYRAEMIVRNTQAQFYAQGSLIWAIDQLQNDWIKQKAKHLIDPTPIQSPENIVNGYHIRSIIEDLQAKYNLNNLATPDSQADFLRLLRLLEPHLTEMEAKNIALATTDWISPAEGERSKTLSDYYAKKLPPYRPAHRLMISISELKLVKGVTPQLYQALKPYICTLPKTTPLNVETAAPPVLMTLSESMTKETAKAILDLRKEKPITAIDEFMNFDIVKNHRISAERITAVSNYFLVKTKVKIEDFEFKLYTLLERNAKDGNVSMRIIWQSMGDE